MAARAARPGRWRVRLLGRLHAALGEDPPLRLLNIAEYRCAGIGEWQQMLGYARRCGRLLAVEPDHYPRHFRALTGFHRELGKLPRMPAVPPLAWETARDYLASHAPAHNVSFGTDPP